MICDQTGNTTHTMSNTTRSPYSFRQLQEATPDIPFGPPASVRFRDKTAGMQYAHSRAKDAMKACEDIVRAAGNEIYPGLKLDCQEGKFVITNNGDTLEFPSFLCAVSYILATRF
jgi:hypothetical protein